MIKGRIILLTIFLSCYLSSYANKDRIERPQTYTFIFQNNDTVILKNPNPSQLKFYADDITTHKIFLIEAYLTFKTGEILSFKAKGNNWTVIKVTTNNKGIGVPENTLRKINEIHFESIALLWNGSYESPSIAGSFYIQFDIGVEKSFGKYAYLQLFFTNKKFEEANIWRQIDERSKQWAYF